jgi:MtN3 and saliva related transmembrane protein
MPSSYVEGIGLIAAALTTTAFLPQVLHTWRRGGQDLSYYMLALYLCGVTLWLVYGLYMHAVPIILANALTDLQVLVLLILKVRRRSPAVQLE